MGKSIPPHYTIQQIEDDSDVKYDVIIDSRERGTFFDRITEILNAAGYTWRQLKLPAGDYLLNRGPGQLSEMKSVSDFIASFTEMDDGDKGKTRLDSEIEKMENRDLFGGINIPRVLILRGRTDIHVRIDVVTETVIKKRGPTDVTTVKSNAVLKYQDDGERWRESGIHPNSFVGIKTKVMYHFPVLELGQIDETISWMLARLKKLIKIEHEVDKGEDPSIKSMRHVSSSLTINEQIRCVVEGFKSIGPKSAIKLLREYKTLRQLFLKITTVEQLTDVGVTTPAAENFIEILDTIYQEEKAEKTEED